MDPCVLLASDSDFKPKEVHVRMRDIDAKGTRELGELIRHAPQALCLYLYPTYSCTLYA